MRTLLAFISLLLAFNIQSAVIVCSNLVDSFGVDYGATTAKFTPVSKVPQQYNSSTVVPSVVQTGITNGFFSANIIAGGIYQFQPLPVNSFVPPVSILVPSDDTNTYTLNQAIGWATNKNNFYWTNSLPFSAGDGVYFTTNGAVIYINSTGGGGGSGTSTNVPFIDVTNNTPGWREARLAYDTTAHTFVFYNDRSNVTYNAGEELFLRGINTSGTTISNGQLVTFDSTGGGSVPRIKLAQSTTNTTGLNYSCVGMATENIANGETGMVTVNGTVHGINTDAWPVNTTLWLGTNAGAYVTNPPPVGYDRTMIGSVARSNGANGDIYISIRQPLHIDDVVGVYAAISATNSATLAATTNLVSIRAPSISVEEFGGLGDGAVSYAMTISGGTVTASNIVKPQLSMALTNGIFTSSDVGKLLYFYTDAANTNWITTTIATYVSPSQVTVSTNATISGTVQGGWGRNNVSAFTNAYAYASKNFAKVVARDGIYLLNGWTLRDGVYAVIHLPNVTSAAIFNPGVGIDTEGGTAPILYPTTYNGTNSLPAPLDGTVLFNVTRPTNGTMALINSSTPFISYDGSGYGNDWNGFSFRNIALRTPVQTTNNAWQDGFRMKYNGRFQIDGVRGDVDFPAGWMAANGDNTSSTAIPSISSTNPTDPCFIRSGTIYNFQGNKIDKVGVLGWPIAAEFGEHTDVGNMQADNCGLAYHINAKPSISGVNIASAIAFSCRKAIVVNTNAAWQRINIGLLRVETHSYATGFPASIIDPQKKAMWNIGMVCADAVFTCDSTNYAFGSVFASDNSYSWSQFSSITNSGPLYQAGNAFFSGTLTGNGSGLTNLTIPAVPATNLYGGTVTNGAGEIAADWRLRNRIYWNSSAQLLHQKDPDVASDFNYMQYPDGSYLMTNNWLLASSLRVSGATANANLAGWSFSNLTMNAGGGTISNVSGITFLGSTSVGAGGTNAACVDFSLGELMLTNYSVVKFVRATNTPPATHATYLGATILGTCTVIWPVPWGPYHACTNTFTNGTIAFKAMGTNVWATGYNP